MVNTTGVTPGLLIKGLNEVFWQEYDKTTTGRIKSNEVFNMQSVDRGMSETDVALAAVSEYQITEEQGNINRQLVKERGQTLYQHDILTSGFDISYKMLLADETGQNSIDQAAQLGRAGRESQDKKRFSILRDNVLIGLDGKTLFAPDHPLAKGGTQSNEIAFNATLYQTIKDVQRVLRDQKQFNEELSIGSDGEMLIATSANWAEIIEVTDAEHIPNSTNNNEINFISKKFPGLKVRWTPYLGSEFGGTDNKFIMLSGKTNHKLKVLTRESLNIWMNDWKEHDNIVSRFNAKYVESFGFSDYLGTVRGASS